MEVGFDDDMARNELMLELIGLECKLSYVYKLTSIINKSHTIDDSV